MAAPHPDMNTTRSKFVSSDESILFLRHTSYTFQISVSKLTFVCNSLRFECTAPTSEVSASQTRSPVVASASCWSCYYTVVQKDDRSVSILRSLAYPTGCFEDEFATLNYQTGASCSIVQG